MTRLALNRLIHILAAFPAPVTSSEGAQDGPRFPRRYHLLSFLDPGLI
jgi:hypothetical protein